MKKYTEIVNELELKVNSLKKDGYKIEPLDNLVDELKQHVKEVNDVEEHIDSIRNIVIQPIKNELDENKTAGKFSIFGFYVGAFGVIVSIISLLYTTFFSTPSINNLKSESFSKEVNVLNEKLDEIRKEILISKELNYIDVNTIKISMFDEKVILSNKENSLKLEVYSINEMSNKDKSVYVQTALLKVEFNGRLMTHKAIPNIIDIKNNYNIENKDKTLFAVSKNSILTFWGKHKFKVLDVYNKRSTTSTLADKEDAIILKAIKE
jgi:predicted ribosome-associated RNA-binding protein Tma20